MNHINFPETENPADAAALLPNEHSAQVSDLLEVKGREVFAASAKTTLATAANILHDHNIGIIVVTDSAGRLVGVLSERDLIALFATTPLGSLRDIPIGDIMMLDVVTCTPEADVLEVLDVMWDSQFRHMPVIENGAVCGVISRTDILHHLRGEVATNDEEYLWGKFVNQL